eukprot:scaffold149423_cov60-Attheya_sp.AAC.1
MVTTMPETPPRSPLKSPVRAIRKKNAFSPNIPYKKKSMSNKLNGIFINIMATLGDEEIITLLKEADTDAYMLNIKSDVVNEAAYIAELEISDCVPRRVSKEEHIVALSRGTNYWGSVIIRVPSEVSTPESRFAACERLAAYMTTHPTNTYRTAYHVHPDTFDLTPDDSDDRPALDSYLMDSDIVDHVKRFLELPTVETDWASQNAPIAHHYFSGPVYPLIACTQLGYPMAPPVLSAMAEGVNN